MDVLWHKILFPCPKCDQEIQITEILAAADEDMLIMGICVRCNAEWKFKTDMNRIKQFCRLGDQQAHDEAEALKNQPLRPPLALPPPQMTEDDLKYLRKMRILDEDKEN